MASVRYRHFYLKTQFKCLRAELLLPCSWHILFYPLTELDFEHNWTGWTILVPEWRMALVCSEWPGYGWLGLSYTGFDLTKLNLHGLSAI